MKTRLESDAGFDARRAAARRTALIVGLVAFTIFAVSIIEVVIQK